MSKKFIELKIAQLERANVILSKLLDTIESPPDEVVNEILDKVLENEALIKKLKEGLK